MQILAKHTKKKQYFWKIFENADSDSLTIYVKAQFNLGPHWPGHSSER